MEKSKTETDFGSLQKDVLKVTESLKIDRMDFLPLKY